VWFDSPATAAAKGSVAGLTLAVCVSVVLFDSQRATAEPTSGEVAHLVVDLADAEQQLSDVGAAIQTRQEQVNKAIVEVQSARDLADRASRNVVDSRRAVADATAAITSARQRFDQYAVANYVNGPSASYLTAASPEDLIETDSQEQTLARSFVVAMATLQRARTEQANKESAARAAEQSAIAAADAARRSEGNAVAALSAAERDFGARRAEVDQVRARRDAARARLVAAAPAAMPQATAQPSGPVPAGGGRWDRAPATDASRGRGQWDTTLPMVPSANVGGDPAAILNSVLQISATSAQVTAQLGRSFLSALGIDVGGTAGGADTGITNGRIPHVYGRQASEYVIRRAMSQMGVPYSWGGGTAAGPSRGIDSGAGTVGFDCSGIVLYAFAGVGIKLQHYSGDQYNAGRKIPSSQMRRGDLIFYGPNASQHEALYLGQGTMLEAPFTGSDVHISPVRTTGMTPYVTRLIEY
jgi:peptidoglycan DL-endopeptidase RipA